MYSMDPIRTLFRPCFRQKTVTQEWMYHSELKRQFSAMDHVAYGLGISVSVGIFITLPIIVQQYAGPSTVISTILAFVLALITSLHVVELATRYPKSGSTFSYAYIVLNEPVAFICGWQMLLDYILLNSLVTKEWSVHLVGLFNSSVKINISDYDIQPIDYQFDWLAIVGLLVAGLFSMVSAKVMAVVVLIMAIVALLITSSSILVGFFYANARNWMEHETFPNGAKGTLQGASAILCGFLSTELVNIVIEEAKQPGRWMSVLPQMLCLFAFIYYFLFSLVLSLITTAHNLPALAPVPFIFGSVSVPASRYVLSVGSVCGLTASTLTLSLPASRILHGIAKEHLVCSIFSYVDKRGQAVVAQMVCIAATMAMTLFDRAGILHVLMLSLPIRCLVILICGLLTRYDVTLPTYAGKVSEYNCMKQRRLVSYMTQDGSIRSEQLRSSLNSLSDSDDGSSITSSFIARNIAAAQFSEATERIHASSYEIRAATNQKETSLNEASTLLVNAKSTNSLHCKHHQNGHRRHNKQPGNSDSFSTLDLGSVKEMRAEPHNCIRSPCSPTVGNSDLHLYDRDDPEVPYIVESQSRENWHDPTKIRLKSRWLLSAYVALCLAVSGVLIQIQMTYRYGLWPLIPIVVLSIALIITATLIARLPHISTESSKHRVPASPYISMFGIALSCLLIMSVNVSSIWRFSSTILPGVLIYLIYGRFKSIEAKREALQTCLHAGVEPNEDQQKIIVNPIADNTSIISTTAGN